MTKQITLLCIGDSNKNMRLECLEDRLLCRIRHLRDDGAFEADYTTIIEVADVLKLYGWLANDEFVNSAIESLDGSQLDVVGPLNYDHYSHVLAVVDRDTSGHKVHLARLNSDAIDEIKTFLLRHWGPCCKAPRQQDSPVFGL